MTRRLYHFLYSALWRLLLPLLWPWWWYRSRASAEAAERGRWRERLALVRYPARARGGLLLHAASVGESVAALPLLRELAKLQPALPLLVSCTSLTGAQRLRRELGDRVDQVFLPFDLPGAMARLLDRVQPRAVVLMETELWPNLIEQARRRAIPVMVANARLSARSARAYARVSPLSRPMLQTLNRVLAQSHAIARRFQALGVPRERISVLGNIKVDVQIDERVRQAAAALRAQLGAQVDAPQTAPRVVNAAELRGEPSGAPPGDAPGAAPLPRRVWVAGSTHPGENEMLLAAFARLLRTHPSALLVLVPRHPERFDAAARAIDGAGLRCARRSRAEVPDAQTPVWLGDTMGEMLTWFALADVAFIGGSLIERGGHSPLEAMAFGVPLLSGPHVRNFVEAYRGLDRASGVRWVHNADEVHDVLHELFDDGVQRERTGSAARRVFDAGAGAAARSAQAVQHLLSDGEGAISRSDDGVQAVWADAAIAPALPVRAFEVQTWQAAGCVRGQAGGRGTVWFVEHGEHELVLRHYRRGGWLGRWVADSYLGRAAERSRAMREFVLLQQMHAAGLPVPRPVAARMQRVGFWRYRADLIVLRIAGAQDVATLLASGQALQPAQWQALGAAVRRLHDFGVYHSDLNCHNLLLDADSCAWIVDFDKCRMRDGQSWKQDNLARLLRSLRKEATKHAGFAWREEEWALLMQGYAA